MIRILTLTALAAGIAGAAHADTPSCSAVPALRHTPPFLGNTTTLRIMGAPPGRAVVLFYSPGAARTQTPVGLLELERSQLEVVAFGMTDASGRWSYDLDVPADPSIAEMPAHFQALVAHPGFFGGAVLSEAAHVRLLGPRIYAGWCGCREDPAGLEPGGMAIVSALDASLVATVDFGAPMPQGRALGDGKPAFCPVCALGAVVPSPYKLVIFDPYFGGVVDVLAFKEASRTIFAHPEGATVFVLETGYDPGPGPDGMASVREIQLCSGAEIGRLDLPALAPGLWVTNDAGTEAYVAELDAMGRTGVRRIDLIQLQDLGALSVGSPTSDEFTDMEWAFGHVFAATKSPDDGMTGRGQLSRIGWRDGSLRATVSETFQWIPKLEALPALGILLAFELQPYVPLGNLWTMRPGDLELRLGIGPYGLHGAVLAAQGSCVWVLDAAVGEPGRLYRYDAAQQRWWQYPGLWPTGPVAFAPLRDAYVDQVVLAVDGVEPPAGIDPELFLIDTSGRPVSERRLAIGPHPDMVHAVPVP